MQAVSKAQAIESESNAGIITVIASPLIGLSAIDLIMLFLGLHRPLGSLSTFLLMYGHFLFAILGLVVILLAGRLGSRALVVGLSSLALGYIISTRFRGPWAWSGTFDYYMMSPQPWILPALIGSLVGVVAVLVRRRPFRSKEDLSSSDVTALGVLVAAAIADLFAQKIVPVDSTFAPTLHLALAGCAIFLGLAWWFVVRPEVTP